MHSPSSEADSQSVKIFRTFYGTRSFITVFTTGRHWSFSWPSYIQSTPPTLFPYNPF